MNIVYIRSTLDKKLGKVKKNGGVVVPSSMATSTATTTEMSQ